MKKTSFFILAFAAFLSVGLYSCSKDNDDSNETATSGGGGDTFDGNWVDLGLPSGLLWADRNLGAETPEGYGDYIAWGETEAKDSYSWSAYRYAEGINKLTKYCSKTASGNEGFTDNLTTLQPMDDAATAKWGDAVRMPTRAEWQELSDNTTATWTTRNGVYGRLMTASNGNSIFLPAAGRHQASSVDGDGEFGYYWTNALYTSDPSYAYDFVVVEDSQFESMGYRNRGQSVRAVRSAR